MAKQLKARLSKPQTAKLIADAGAVVIKAGAGEGDAKGPATFGGIAYSGGVAPRHTLSGANLDADYIIDLSGMKPGRGVKANLDHKPTQRVGHVTTINNDGKQVAVEGILSAQTEYRDQVASSAANGYPWESSIEASLGGKEKLAAGKTAVVNGRNVSGPLYIFRRSTLTDLGFVDHGADSGNHITIAASAAGVHHMDEFETFCASLGIADVDALSDEQKSHLTGLHQMKKNSGANTSGRAKSFAEIAGEERAEFARQEVITKMGYEAMKDAPMYIDQIEKAVQSAIEAKMSAERFELELLRNMRSRSGQFKATMSGTQNDPKVIEAALCLATGLPNIEKHYNEKTLEAVDRCGLRQISLQQVLLQAAATNGYSCRAGERITGGNLRAVLKACFSDEATARLGFSTAALPNILGAVANKQILAGYMEEDGTWKDVATVKSVSNFYTQNYYRMLDSLEYEEVGSGGELHHGTLGEETYTSKAKTYGKMLGLTRNQIINDDLGAFDDIRTRLGRGAAKKFNNVFWTAFMDNSSFFTSGNTNYITGSTTNLGTDGVGLGLGVKGCRLMTSPSADGTKRVGMGFTPTILLVPPELETIGLQLYGTANLGYVSVSSANIFANRYRPVVQNRLSDSAFTGNSTTAWYLIGPTMKPMLVTFLNGNQTPTVESSDADFDTLGILFRGYHDFSADKSEYLSALKSKGAA
jgi:phage major head subunit gpT-like protein